MNKMKSLTQTRQPHARDCECGCADCPDDTCRLECLTRPNFFYGQALKDDDLTAIVEYTRARLALERYRDGWGVACGLHVDIDPQVGGGVIVNPGYAVDYCGNDIVVCDPLRFDLTSLLPPPDDCRQPAPSPVEQIPMARPIEAMLRHVRPERSDGQEEEKEKPSSAAPRRYVIDLYLKHGEKKTSPQTTLVRSRCRDGAGCEYSRVVEHGVVEAVLVEAPYAMDDPSTSWLEGLRRIVRAVSVLVDEVEPILKSLAPPEAAKRTLALFRRWLNAHALHETDYVRALELASGLLAAGRIPNLTESESVQNYIANLINVILNDMISHYVRCGCSPCADERGIRLARIALFDTTRMGNSSSYMIYFINNQPPVRRDLSLLDCHPAPPGKISLAHVLGKTPEAAKVWLASQGVKADETSVQPLTLGELAQLASQPLDDLVFVDPTRESMLTLFAQRGEPGVIPDRVVLFGPAYDKKFDGQDGHPPKETVAEAAVVAGTAGDDLGKISGIGKKRQEVLTESGILTYRQLGDMTVDGLRELFEKEPIPLAEMEVRKWIAEASELANQPPEEPEP
jgi:predicted flap endonuclease-1-like 5' DNA nuclease